MKAFIRRFSIQKGIAALAAAFLLLSVLPQTSQAAEDAMLIDFEDGTIMGFDVRGTEAEKASGTGVLTAVTEEAHTGQYSLLITERKNGWNGPAYNVTSRVIPGADCTISIWVLPKTPESATFTLSTETREGNSVSYINIEPKVVSKADGWTELTGHYSYGNEEFITIYVESSTSEGEFYVDDFSFTVTGNGEGFKAWDPATDPLTNNKRGEYEGFDYEYWSQNINEGSMWLTGGGTFRCEWDGNNLLFRTGKRLGSTMNYKEYGNVTVDYAAQYSITRGDVSYLTIYGWTQDPMIEFYIVENYGNYKPGGAGYKGDIVVDGATYEVYENTRVEMPSIQGTKTFQQYFSVRKDKRSEGTITVSDHFKAWEELGLDMSGTLYEITFCAEGFNSAGTANLYKHVLTVGEDVYGAGVEASAPSADPGAATESTPAPSPEPSLISEPAQAASPTPNTTEDVSGENDGSNTPSTAIIIICVIAGAVILAVIAALLLRSKRAKR